MFKKLQKILPYVSALALVFVFSIHQAHADFLGIGNITLGVIDTVVAGISQLVLWVMHYWVTVTAGLFSVSVNLNLHIKQFVDQTAGVYTVWKTIRDVCSLFIIFMLLYTAIKLILSQEEKGLEGVGHLIKNIVIAGILINFSFFITGLLIDVSNMASLAIYKGIVSTDQNAGVINNSDLNITSMTSRMLHPQSNQQKDVNLADFFMTKLSPQSVFKVDLTDKSVTGSTADGTPAPLRTLVQGVVGAIIMFTIGMSFLFAAIAFASRLVILIILLAFSSIWFASWIFPSLKEKSDEFVKILKGQLIFMPVYLLLLYAALIVLKNSSVFTQTSAPVGTDWVTGYITLAINDFFIIFLLNLPLVTAFAFAKESTSWLGADKLNANAIWGHVSGFAGSNTIGRLGYKADEYLAKTRIGNLALGRDLRAATTGALVKAKMGGNSSYEDVRVQHADVTRRAAANARLRDLKKLIASKSTNSDDYKKVIGPMTPKERLELTPEIWQNPQFSKQIDDSDYKAYRKSERVEDTDAIKENVKQNRRLALRDAVKVGEDKVVKHMLDEMNGHEMMKQVGKFGKMAAKDATPTTPAVPADKLDGENVENDIEILKDPDLIKHLSPAHLKMMEDENLDDEVKSEIGKQIYYWKKNHPEDPAHPEIPGRKNHPAFGFITRNDNRSWLAGIEQEDLDAEIAKAAGGSTKKSKGGDKPESGGSGI